MNDYIEYADIGGPEGIDLYDKYENEIYAAERAAENAWLIAAESPTNDDLAFEAWEMGRGCYLDPQSGYAV